MESLPLLRGGASANDTSQEYNSSDLEEGDRVEEAVTETVFNDRPIRAALKSVKTSDQIDFELKAKVQGGRNPKLSAMQLNYANRDPSLYKDVVRYRASFIDARNKKREEDQYAYLEQYRVIPEVITEAERNAARLARRPALRRRALAILEKFLIEKEYNSRPKCKELFWKAAALARKKFDNDDYAQMKLAEQEAREDMHREDEEMIQFEDELNIMLADANITYEEFISFVLTVIDEMDKHEEYARDTYEMRFAFKTPDHLVNIDLNPEPMEGSPAKVLNQDHLKRSINSIRERQNFDQKTLKKFHKPK